MCSQGTRLWQIAKTMRHLFQGASSRYSQSRSYGFSSQRQDNQTSTVSSVQHVKEFKSAVDEQLAVSKCYEPSSAAIRRHLDEKTTSQDAETAGWNLLRTFFSFFCHQYTLDLDHALSNRRTAWSCFEPWILLALPAPARPRV